jgi:glutamate-1-semialdehyde 2,1-aminomutase
MSYQPSKTLPGGVSSYARALGPLDGRDFYVKSSRGARLVDSYGTSFVDYGMAMGANLLGHAHPAVVKACTAALENGSMPGFPNVLENEAADALARVGGERVNRVTFTTTGTEAVHLAFRLVRAKTGRKLIAKSVGGYDGWFEEVRFGLVNSPETSRSNQRPARSDVTLFRVNDPDDLHLLFAEYGNDLAAVIVEPLLGNTACLKPDREWVELLNDLAEKHGVMIISDEVMVGLRQGVGLVADKIGLRPDLVTMGKAIGTGLPVAALLGTNEAFALFDNDAVTRSGTYHGNPFVAAAILATFDTLENVDFQSGLYDYGAKMRAGIVEAFASHGIHVSTAGFDSVFSLWFSETVPANYDEALEKVRIEASRITYEELRRNGVIGLPSPWGRYFVSFAHGEEDLDITLRAFRAAAANVASAKVL